MAKRSDSKRVTKTVGKPKSKALDARLFAYLKEKAPAEDVATYNPKVLELAAADAASALERHKIGSIVIAIDNDADFARNGKPMSAITVVNDNMPFLFDSIMGEITDVSGEPSLVVHPVFGVHHTKSGVDDIMDDGLTRKHETDADRVSLIHVHVPRLSEEKAAELDSRLTKLVKQIRSVVRDWKPMLARLDQAISQFRYAPAPLDKHAVAEAIAFLEWLRDDNFTFLGMREFTFSGNEKGGTLKRVKEPGLGILSDPDVTVLRRDAHSSATTSEEVRAFLYGPEPLVVTKANAKSNIHRRAYLDYIGVKQFDAKGKLSGELRIVGLFTSTAYTRSVMKIPYLRSKAEAVIAKSGYDSHDHAGKALINVLESYPRDELFQTPLSTLRKHSEAILGLVDRPRVRALVRVDQFDRFVSVLVFVPRDRYDSVVREKIGNYLKTAFDGRLSAFYPAFPEGGLARVHFIIGRSGGKTPKVDPTTIEAAIRDIVRTWEDSVREAATGSDEDTQLAGLANRFPASYRDSFAPSEALVDARRVAALDPQNTIDTDFYRKPGQRPNEVALKIYHFGSPVSLSRRVPLLENMGFRVISERTFEVGDENSEPVFVHDMELESGFDRPLDLSDDGLLFEEVFLSVWRGEADNDAYNALAQTAGLHSGELGLLRAYGRYLQQAGIPQSQEFIAGTLNRYPEISRGLYALFTALFDPKAGKEGEVTARHLKAKIKDALDEVPNIDDDTIIRRYVNLIDASLRTNHFTPPTPGKPRSLAIKLDSRAIDGLPEPRPWREIYVYGPEVEGVHLRFGPVARGGLRWSDRAQDYRTEVLGLVKAQQVKNAVIVPVGAKGGFYPKRLPSPQQRDVWFEAGRQAYINFISSLLSLTDNLDGAKVVPPKDMVRRDADDPYFVVAADKGTATFSDTANGISQSHDFWLDDAFASGGSAGYDHKKMGITAKGAWEAVKRHFREMNRDIQTQPFTTVGVGDMSGDVFGNGMLLSEQTRLIAAFDHRDIFIDPDPDVAASFAERARMFALPRSSWQDYDKSKLSKGGAIISRAQKSVQLSPEAQAAIGLSKGVASPAEILNAILKADVDLLWFGGIGTYVRSSAETSAEVGDRANDNIRVTAAEVRAKVIGEGANLGVTQKARIEYGLLGGRCNSDAIDNSGGVNSSDVEVNIKIALANAMRSNRLTRPARNKLLTAMTDEVGRLVLANNYSQSLAVSQAQKAGMADLGHQARFISILEQRKQLDRTVENLPSPAVIAQRQARGEPLTRAELGVLLAYAKIVLFSEIIATDVPDDPHFHRDLLSYFPDQMEKKYLGDIQTHRLRREIITRVLSNDVINRGGPAFVTRMQEATGRGPREVVRAFAMVRDGFDLDELYSGIDALDNKIDGQLQLDLYGTIAKLTIAACAWDLKNGDGASPIAAQVTALRAARKEIRTRIADLVPAAMRERIYGRRDKMVAAGVPEALALRLALLELAEMVPDIALIAQRSGAEIGDAARAYFAITEAFRIGRIAEAANALSPADYYDSLALARAQDTIAAARRAMTIAALKGGKGAKGDPVAAWIEAGGARLTALRERLLALTEGGDITVSRLSVAAGLMADLG